MTKEEIKGLRKALDYSQSEMATYLKVNISSIKAWESGRRVPNESQLAQLEEIMEMDGALESLMTDEIKKVEDATPSMGIIEKAMQTYLTHCEELGCNPNVGIMKGALKAPFRPCWLIDSDIEYELKDGKWTQM